MCAANPAGVAWLNGTDVTTPVALPSASARSVRFSSTAPSGPMPTVPLVVFTPVASAVAAAAESVAPEVTQPNEPHAAAPSYDARPLTE